MFGLAGHHIATLITAFVAAAPLFSGSWAAITWALQRRNDRRNKEFETYHKLIKDLVEPADQEQRMFVDRQIAVIFELRRFKFYRPVTRRILAGLKETWKHENRRLLDEIADSLKALGEPEE